MHGAFEDGTAWQHVVSIPCDQLTNDDAALDRAFDKVPVASANKLSSLRWPRGLVPYPGGRARAVLRS